MPKADVENTTTNGFPSTTRRGLLAGAAALSAGAVVAVPALAAGSESADHRSQHPTGDRIDDADAELIRLADEATALDRESDRLSFMADKLPPRCAGAEALHEQIFSMVDEWHERLQLISEMPACTEAGLKAKARIVADFLQDSADSCENLAVSLARDILGRA